MIESKSAGSYSLKGDGGILLELDKAMANREADFAIGVNDVSGGWPKCVGVFGDYEGNKIVCEYGEEGEIFEIAYKLARIKVIQEKMKNVEIDAKRISNNIEKIKDSLQNFSNIKTKCTTIEKSQKEIKSIVDEFKEEINDGLEELEKGLNT